jgi:hypothetical protein
MEVAVEDGIVVVLCCSQQAAHPALNLGLVLLLLQTVLWVEWVFAEHEQMLLLLLLLLLLLVVVVVVVVVLLVVLLVVLGMVLDGRTADG